MKNAIGFLGVYLLTSLLPSRAYCCERGSVLELPARAIVADEIRPSFGRNLDGKEVEIEAHANAITISIGAHDDEAIKKFYRINPECSATLSIKDKQLKFTRKLASLLTSASIGHQTNFLTIIVSDAEESLEKLKSIDGKDQTISIAIN